MAAAGLTDPQQLQRAHIYERAHDCDLHTLEDRYPTVRRCLLLLRVFSQRFSLYRLVFLVPVFCPSITVGGLRSLAPRRELLHWKV